MSEKKQITISSVITLLEEGKTRKEIAAHFGISQTSCRKMFQHPELKNKKPHIKKEPEFVLVDDINTETTQSEPVIDEETVEDAVEETASY